MRFTVPDSPVISVRVSRADHTLLTEAARARSMKLSTYIKGAALDDARLLFISHSLEAERTTA